MSREGEKGPGRWVTVKNQANGGLNHVRRVIRHCCDSAWVVLARTLVDARPRIDLSQAEKGQRLARHARSALQQGDHIHILADPVERTGNNRIDDRE